MTPSTAAALRALVSEIRERANRPVNDSIAHIAYNWCADSIEIIAKQLAAEPTISELADRFLGWPLPESVNPDMCVHAKGEERANYRLIGTHLLTHSEACVMLEYVLKPDGRGKTPAQCPKHESANNAGVATGSRNDSARESDLGRPSDSTTPAELAAVLTQEGAVLHTIDFDQWFNASKYMQVVYSPDSRQPALDGWNAALARAAPAEPRAAEGAGMGNWPEDSTHENGNYTCECCQCGCQFMGHKRRVTCKVCATKPTAASAVPVKWRDKPGDVFRSFKAICKLPEGEARSEAFLWFSHGYACMNPLPAAAAVPAGGDAVAWLIERRPDSCAPSWYNGEHRAGCDALIHSFTTESTKAIRYPTRSAALYALTGLRSQVAELDNVADLYVTEHEWIAPAPRGGVTEAMLDLAEQAYLDRYDAEYQEFGLTNNRREALRSVLETVLSTPPAAQAQDAEPMAMHLREAFQEWRAGAIDSLRLNDAWDVIWNRARALAAKEAK